MTTKHSLFLAITMAVISANGLADENNNPKSAESIFQLSHEEYAMLLMMNAYILECDISSSDPEIAERKAGWQTAWRAQVLKETPGFAFPSDLTAEISAKSASTWTSDLARDSAFLQIWTFAPYYPLPETEYADPASLSELQIPEKVKVEAVHFLAHQQGVSHGHVDRLMSNYQAHLEHILGGGFWRKVTYAVLIAIGITVVVSIMLFAPPVGVATGVGGATLMLGSGTVLALSTPAIAITGTVYLAAAVAGVMVSAGGGVGLGLELAKSSPKALAQQVSISHALYIEVLESQKDQRLAQELIRRQSESIRKLNDTAYELEQRIDTIDSLHEDEIKLYKTQIDNLNTSVSYYRKSLDEKNKELEAFLLNLNAENAST